jgi:hypothetical protein
MLIYLDIKSFVVNFSFQSTPAPKKGTEMQY